MKLIFFHYGLVFKPEMENSCLYSLESESSQVWLIQVCEVDMKWGRDSPKVIPPPLNVKIAWLNKPQRYLTTKLTSLPGTQIAFTTVLPSIHLAAASSAAARISSCVAVAEISTRLRSLPST